MFLKNYLISFFFILTFTILCFFLKIPVWGNFDQSSTLHVLDYDFILFSNINENSFKFENSLILEFVQKVNNGFPVLILVSKFLLSQGISLSIQVTLFYFMQLFLGFLGLYLILSSFKLTKMEIALILCFFLFSFFVDFGRYLGGPAFYNKVTTGMMAISFGYLSFGLFLLNKIRTSIIVATFLFYLHPIHSLILLFVIFSNQAFNNFSTKLKLKKILINIFISAAILAPFIINYFFSSNFELLNLDISIKEDWWSYAKAKTTNAFPLQDGLIVVIPSLMLFGLSYFMLGKLNQFKKLDSIKKAQWIVGCLFSLWIIQIFFTEVLLIQFIAMLALTRVTPYLLLFMTITFILTVLKLRTLDKKGIWLLFLIVPILSHTHMLPIEHIRYIGEVFFQNTQKINYIILITLFSFPLIYLMLRLFFYKKYISILLILIIMPSLIVLSYLGGLKHLSTGTLLQLPMIFVGWLWPDFSIYPEMLLLFICLIFYGYSQNYFTYFFNNNLIKNEIILYLKFQTLLILFFVFYVYFLDHENVKEVEMSTFLIIRGCLYIIISVFFIDYFFFKNYLFKNLSLFFNKHNIYLFTLLFLLTLVNPLNNVYLFKINESQSEELKDITKTEKIWHFLEKHSNETDMALIVPFWDARVIPIMPLRPVFVDWADAQYVLYDPGYLDKLLIRYKLIGFDIDKSMFADKCKMIMQYVEPMCRKKIFEDTSKIYNQVWRKNLDKMKEITPNLKFVILRTKYLRKTDHVLYNVDDLNVIEVK